MPIKTQHDIHEFFNKNDGLEFIHFSTEEESISVRNRVLYYHFMKFARHKNKCINYIGKIINLTVKVIQYIIKFERKWDKSIKLKYGSQWFSITHKLAKHIIDKEDWINKHFKYTSCSDELFLQTIVYNSKFKDNLYKKEIDGENLSYMRYIDWKRGEPYVFKNADFKCLVNSDMFFARKFSSKVDNEIIEKIFNYLNEKEFDIINI